MKYSLLAMAAVVILMSAACARYGSDVRTALLYAGDNREELEKVIRHYGREQADSLKLKAASYLIGNMAYHRSYPAEQYGRYCREVDSLFLCVERDSIDAIKEEMEKISRKYAQDMVPLPDVRIATADYLIWNIDYSFRQWETSPFLQHLDFQQFCEYVLPYKCVDCQPLSRWKEEYGGVSRGEMDTFWQLPDLQHNVRMAVKTSQTEIKDSLGFAWLNPDCIPLLDFIPLMHMPVGTCIEYSILGMLNSRSKGLPVSLDMIPSWPDRNGIHHWNNILTDKRRNIDFVPFENSPGEGHYTDNGFAKVYRYGFAPDAGLLRALKKEGRLHGRLNNVFLHDVTTEYCKTADVQLKLDSGAKGNAYAYLCVFDNFNWVPVAISGINGRKVQFNDLGLGVVYLPVVYKGNGQIPSGAPFLLDTRRRKIDLQANGGQPVEMRLQRKYPAFNHIYSVREYLRGGRIEAADNPHFRNAAVMAEFPEDRYLSHEEKIRDTTAFRFWRLVSSGDSPGDFAELYFYSRKTGKQVSGKMIVPDNPVRDKLYDIPEHICDGNPLSYFRTEAPERWVGFDFGEPMSMGEIAYLRRGDGSDICPGNHYEFYYWDGGGWHLHGEKTAERVYLEFKDVPSGGLYYLKCTTNGNRQRIFMYENGTQIWY
ncbi:MAG: discoidin domain-containing protein [Clostridium sp.]|nr:discoidin domain-containing protein [Bacteroides sp.]MCM1198101.1 discoidin domain-containing protein [Clostridium sp.]